jgi:hypothetical protein
MTLRQTFRPSAATLVIGLTGGSDDEVLSIQQRTRLVFLVGQVLFYALTLVVPIVVTRLIRKWAATVLETDRPTHR